MTSICVMRSFCTILFWALFALSMPLTGLSFLGAGTTASKAFIETHRTFRNHLGYSRRYHAEVAYTLWLKEKRTGKDTISDHVESGEEYINDGQLKSDNFPTRNTRNADVVEATRVSLVKLMEESWVKVTQMVSREVLQVCEEDLRSATSLLVLATIRRAADELQSSRITFQGMLQEADRNSDGKLSYIEWLDWLTYENQSSSSTIAATTRNSSKHHQRHERQEEQQQFPQAPFEEFDGKFVTSVIASSIVTVSTGEVQPIDPMVHALGQVLGFATSTMRVMARMTDNPDVLTASFVAGGMSAGLLDEAVCRTMLARLTPESR